MMDNPGATTVIYNQGDALSLSNYTTFNGTIFVDRSFSGDLVLPGIQEITGYLAGIDAENLTSVSVPNLTTSNDFHFDSCSRLSRISAPAYTTAQGCIWLVNNSALDATISFPVLSTVAQMVWFNGSFSGVDMPSIDTVEDGMILQSTRNISSTCDYFESLVQAAGCMMGGNITCRYPGTSLVIDGNDPTATPAPSSSNTSTSTVSSSTSATAALVTSQATSSSTAGSTSPSATANPTTKHGDMAAIAGGIAGGIVGLLLLLLLIFLAVKRFVRHEVGRKNHPGSPDSMREAFNTNSINTATNTDSGPLTPRIWHEYMNGTSRGTPSTDVPGWLQGSPLLEQDDFVATGYVRRMPVEIGVSREPQPQELAAAMMHLEEME